MNVFWVASDNNKCGGFSQTKAEILCTFSSLFAIKDIHPNFQTSFFLDSYTKKYYQQLNSLKYFDFLDTKLLDKDYDINFNIFFSAPKIIVLNQLEGPVLNLDLDFHYRYDLSSMGIFESDISALWLERTDLHLYPSHQEGMSMAPLSYNFTKENYALCVCFLFIKNGFFRKLLTENQLNFMKTASKSPHEKFWETQRYYRTIFVEQYLPFLFAKNFNQEIKLIIDDFSDPISEMTDIKSLGIRLDDAKPFLYHFGGNKNNILGDDSYHQVMIDWIYEHSLKVIKNQKNLSFLKEIYDTPMNDGCFKY